MIKLKRDDSVFFTTETVDYFIKHRAEFHSNIEELKQCKQSILDGKVIPRVNTEQGDKFFHISYERTFVGELWIYRYKEPIEEISIRVFDDYQGRGYATTAIIEYATHFRDSNVMLVANCESTNPRRDIILKMLTKCEFQYSKEMEIYVYR